MKHIAAKRRRMAKLKIAGQLVALDAPGLKAMKRGGGRIDLYWIASKDAVDRGYPQKTRRIFVDLTDPSSAGEIERICRTEQSAMLAWLDDPEIDRRPRRRYDGTLSSLIDLYLADPDSGFHDLAENTAMSYEDSLKVIRDTVGARRLDRLHAKDFRRWYKNWRKPRDEVGEERVRRAYGAVQLLRIILAYGIQSGISDCHRLRSEMEGMRFSKNPPRERTLSFAQAEAFIKVAIARGEPGLALAQALQFECMLRQSDVIGAWRSEPSTYVLEANEIRAGGKVWRGLTWAQITMGDDLVIRTSKTGQPVVHVLAACQLVTFCLNNISSLPTNGPIAARKDGQPWGDRRSFGKEWREIATAAGVPREVWNRDNRASGITEAAEAGARDDDIARNAAHADKTTTRRVYKRLGHEASVRIHESRAQHRAKRKDPQ